MFLCFSVELKTENVQLMLLPKKKKNHWGKLHNLQDVTLLQNQSTEIGILLHLFHS